MEFMKYELESGTEFTPWQPSTWPDVPASFDGAFADVLERIIQETVLDEITNVISDAQKVQGTLEHRGHVIGLSMLCAIDTLAAYTFPPTNVPCPSCGRGDTVGPNYRSFITEYFPADYQLFAEQLYTLYRSTMVHSWNLFGVGILPGDENISNDGGVLFFGLLNFNAALKTAFGQYKDALAADAEVQKASLARYRQLKATARRLPARPAMPSATGAL